MDNDVVDIINVCVHTWLLILVVCFLTLSEIAFLCVCVCVCVCVCICVFCFPLERENYILGYQLQGVEELLHFT